VFACREFYFRPEINPGKNQAKQVLRNKSKQFWARIQLRRSPTRILHSLHEAAAGWSSGLQPAFGKRTRKAGGTPALRAGQREKTGLRSILLPAGFIMLAVLVALSGTLARASSVSIEQLRCEYLPDPMGIDATQPRFDWILVSNQRSEQQAAYQILVASSPELLGRDKGDLWDTGKVLSDETTQIAYQGSPLVSRERCYWKVQVWDQDGRATWSPVAQWQMGLLQPADWSAEWISAGTPAGAAPAQLTIRNASYEAADGHGSTAVTAALTRHVRDNRLIMLVNNKNLGVDPAYNHIKQLHVDYELNGQPHTLEVNENETLALPPDAGALPYLRKSFDVTRRVQRAVLYATALGLYQVDLNGRRVGDHVFAPDWTDYRKRLRYQAYDVTTLLQHGNNAIGAILANGWYSGHIGNGGFQFFGKAPAFLAQLEITYDDGTTKTIATDSSWKSHPSAILSSDFMMGEDYDARREIKGWDAAGLDDTQWTPVEVREEPTLPLQAQVMEPVRELGELKPREVTEPQPGRWVYDLGQNMVGVVRLKISAPAGTEITLRHAEVLNPDGTLYTLNLRGAPSVDHYTCSGKGVETWQPRFTFHGFRYVQITGLKNNPGKDAVTGIVIGSDTPRAGYFTCSDPRINQLESNILWGQRGNYLSVPTDCPQRDERLGWMGDAQVFVRTATYNADVAAFFSKWLVDVDDGQSSSGAFGDVSPNTMRGKGTPGWGDAGVICPWTIYDVYGDKRLLAEHLPNMIRWVDYLAEHSDDLIRSKGRGSDYGDWLSINDDTPKDLIGTAYFAYVTHLVAKSCAALDRSADADKYGQLFEKIKEAFFKQYVSPDGRIKGGSQTAYLLALKFDLLPEAVRPLAVQHLEENLKGKGWHLSTGFLGVGYLLPTLEEAGKSDVAYRLLLQDTYPSWLFPVEHGATTIWERWDGWTPNKGFQDPGMNSFNHYSLGSCGEFLFGGIGGIRSGSPGYKTILIDPVIGPGLNWARTSYDSIHGKIATDWKMAGNRLSLDVTIPANTRATVCIPAKDRASVRESKAPLDKAHGVKFLRQENNKVMVEIGSGTYHFNSEIGEAKLAD
jgi:alpha-L-rhamnosidase